MLQFHFKAPHAQRLDKYLVDCLPDLSRARIQSLIRDGLVTVDGVLPKKTGLVLEGYREVVVNIPAPIPAKVEPEYIPLDILFENEDLLAVNKPAGLVVHPAAGHSSGTLVHAVLAHVPQLEGVGGELRPGVVHRLDRDTSGVILLAKNDRSHRWLQEQFRLRKVHKNYLALVDGHPPTPSGRIDAAIGRDPKMRKKMAVVQPDKGRTAVTDYRTLEKFPEHTYLDIFPVTGRTHQIRLHLAFLGCPVTGDTVYGRKHPSLKISRHFLHAERLSVLLRGENVERCFFAPLPPELEEVLQSLRSAK
ncbi:MAG: hypothetical protein A2Z16_02495 [Chloroflexi bacterium RBG_16_54_18]|nr:MAG: hypothetical protein A2Z16_02495 [Chloroflexi bacterium RBG_16_54_18]